MGTLNLGSFFETTGCTTWAYLIRRASSMRQHMASGPPARQRWGGVMMHVVDCSRNMLSIV